MDHQSCRYLDKRRRLQCLSEPSNMHHHMQVRRPRNSVCRLLHPTKWDQVNDVLLGGALDTEQQPVRDIGCCDEASPRDQPVLDLPELFPAFESKCNIHVTRRTPRVEAEDMPQEHVTSHSTNEEIREAQLLRYRVDRAHNGQSDWIDRAVRLDAKHARSFCRRAVVQRRGCADRAWQPRSA